MFARRESTFGQIGFGLGGRDRVVAAGIASGNLTGQRATVAAAAVGIC